MNDATTQQSGESLWARLRRRKLVQWGLAYAAGAWGFQQGLAYISTLLDWPVQVQRLTGLALLIGLPIALVLAWYHGDRGQRQVTRNELAILTLLFLLGGGIFWYFQRASETTTSTVASSAQPAAAALATDASIAVLPFVNMSPDKEQEYFADGISEELLNLLAQVPDLRVIARTSSFSFKGKDVDIAEIARKLNVANVLEGSVRKSGDTLRITAQLVRASDSSHLWSQTYDRQMTDVFKVQDEIAANVVRELKVSLLGAAPTARETNPEAYALYLQARQLGRQGTAEAYAKSDALYQQVLALDPHYAPAWDGLAANYINETGIGVLSNQEGYARAREAAQKALAIDPDYALAHASSGWIAMYGANDPAAAAPHFERALALDPSDLEVLGRAANLLPLLGRLDEALALQEAIVRRDPVNVNALFNLGFSQRQAGRFDVAIASQRTALSLSPGGAQSHVEIGVALLLKGELLPRSPRSSRRRARPGAWSAWRWRTTRSAVMRNPTRRWPR